MSFDEELFKAVHPERAAVDGFLKWVPFDCYALRVSGACCGWRGGLVLFFGAAMSILRHHFARFRA